MPWHYHEDALNALVYGEKRWYLRPPEAATYSVEHPTDALASERGARGAVGAVECVQRARAGRG